jgi:hypothetical protein
MDWILIFDGKTISLDPSIGNWSFACQSHYWIKRNKIRWGSPFSEGKIATVRAYDSSTKEKYFGINSGDDLPVVAEVQKQKLGGGLWAVTKRWWTSR